MNGRMMERRRRRRPRQQQQQRLLLGLLSCFLLVSCHESGHQSGHESGHESRQLTGELTGERGLEGPPGEYCVAVPCDFANECRSNIGFCGVGETFCNSHSKWVPACGGGSQKNRPDHPPSPPPPPPTRLPTPRPTAMPVGSYFNPSEEPTSLWQLWTHKQDEKKKQEEQQEKEKQAQAEAARESEYYDPSQQGTTGGMPPPPTTAALAPPPGTQPTAEASQESQATEESQGSSPPGPKPSAPIDPEAPAGEAAPADSGWFDTEVWSVPEDENEEEGMMNKVTFWDKNDAPTTTFFPIIPMTTIIIIPVTMFTFILFTLQLL